MELKIEGVDELLNDLQRAGKLNERTWKPLHQAMQESVNQIEAQAKQNVTGNNSIASGELRKGITNEVQYQPHALVGIVSAHAEGIEVGNLSDEDVEFLSKVAHMVVAEGKRPAIETATTVR